MRLLWRSLWRNCASRAGQRVRCDLCTVWFVVITAAVLSGLAEETLHKYAYAVAHIGKCPEKDGEVTLDVTLEQVSARWHGSVNYLSDA